jgi:hypothetical protein
VTNDSHGAARGYGPFHQEAEPTAPQTPGSPPDTGGDPTAVIPVQWSPTPTGAAAPDAPGPGVAPVSGGYQSSGAPLPGGYPGSGAPTSGSYPASGAPTSGGFPASGVPSSGGGDYD